MSCHETNSTATTMRDAAAAVRTIVLVGNPNVGKSVLFSKLTGKFVIISNYPGTTVEITRGEARIGDETLAVIDTPGVNELAPRTEDARVTCDVLREHPDATIVQVADAKNLRRALLLTMQLTALRRPMVLVLNMMDELEKRGGQIDVPKLSDVLDVPVVPTIATEGTGLEELKQSIERARCSCAPVKRESLSASQPSALHRSAATPSYEETAACLADANRILAQTYTLTPPRESNLAQRLGWWSTHPVKGLAILLAVLYFTFWFVGLLGAGTFVDFFETVVFGRYINPWAIRATDAVLPFPHTHESQTSDYKFEIPFSPTHGIELASSSRETFSPTYALAADAKPGWGPRTLRFVHDFLVGEYGMITMALSYGFAIVLPIVTTFFLLFGLLEDSGYLPRLAVMVNRIFRGMGLNGKAVLPMVLGLGCDTMATMTTRILETRKERVITTLLLAMAASISFAAAAFWVCLMIGIMFVIGWLAAQLYGGQTSDFILELPPMRLPQTSNVAMKTFARLEWYLKEVIPLFMLGTGILFFLDTLNVLGKTAQFGEPLVKGWLGLPAETANAFLIGFLRRDYGAVYLLDAATGPGAILTPHEVLVAMVTITLFMPCIATLFMIARELGRKTAATIAVFVFAFAFFVGGLVHHVATWMGI